MKKLLLIVIISLCLSMLVGAGPEHAIEFTEDEIEWMHTHPLISYAPDPYFGPIEYLDENGVLKGASIDYLEWIEAQTGLKFEIVMHENWDDIIQATKNGEVDMVTATWTKQRAEYLTFTTPFIAMPNVIITRLDGPESLDLKDLHSEEVVVIREYAIHDYLEDNHPEIELYLVNDLDVGLSLVSFGTKKYMVVSIAQVSYFLKETAVTNLKVSGNADFTNELSFAVQEELSLLQKIIDKTLDAMPKSEKDRIYSKWISIDAEPAISPEMVILMKILIAIALVVVVLVLFFNKILRLKVEEKTGLYRKELTVRKEAEKQLEELNICLEEKVEERTDELMRTIDELKTVQRKLIDAEKMVSLGRMAMGVSHQMNTPLGTSVTMISWVEKKQAELKEALIEGTIDKEGLVKYLNEIEEATFMTEREIQRVVTFVNHFKELYIDAHDQEKSLIQIDVYFKSIRKQFRSQLTKANIDFQVDFQEDLVINMSPILLNNIFKNLIKNSLEHGFKYMTFGSIKIQVIQEDDLVTIVYEDNGIGIEKEVLSNVYEPLFTTSMGQSTGLGLNILYNTVVTSLGGQLELSSDVDEGIQFVMRFNV